MFAKYNANIAKEGAATDEDSMSDNVAWFPREYAPDDYERVKKRSICQRMNVFFKDPTESFLGETNYVIKCH